MNKFGFIGCGNMGGALAAALAKSKNVQIFLSNPTVSKAESLSAITGGAVSDNKTIAENCDYIVLGVKPQKMSDVMNEIAGVLIERKTRFVLVSMAAGLSTDSLQSKAGGEYPTIRIMPNTAVEVGCGMTLYCKTEQVTQDEMNQFLADFSAAGMFEPVPEPLMDAASAVSGCGPAFVYMFIEALADGGVRCGLPRDKAIKAAAKTVEGAGKMVLETARHPADLKDAVCSPAGSTIAGVQELEASGFRSAAMDAVCASFERTKELGK